MWPFCTPLPQRLAERRRPRQRRFGAVRTCCEAVPGSVYSGPIGLELAAHPDKTNGSMLRGIHKASANWLGRVVMGVLLGLIAISFGIWGIGDIFRGFGQSTVAKVGGTEIRVDSSASLSGPAAAARPPVGRPILPDQARALGLDRQLLAQVIAETVLDERARVAAARHQRRRDRAPDHREPELQGHQRPVRPRALRGGRCATSATPRRGSWPSSGATRCASS